MRFPLSSMIMVAVAGVNLFLYIMFNYAFHGESGLKNILWGAANKTMGTTQLADWNELMVQLPQGFGIACVLCFAMALVFFVADAFMHPREGV